MSNFRWEGLRQLVLIASLAAFLFTTSVSVELAALEDESVLLVGRGLLVAAVFVLATIGILGSSELSVGTFVSPVRRFVVYAAASAYKTLVTLACVATASFLAYELGVGSVHHVIVGCDSIPEKDAMSVQWYDWRRRDNRQQCSGTIALNVWNPLVRDGMFATSIRCAKRGFTPFPASKAKGGGFVCDVTATEPPITLKQPPKPPVISATLTVPKGTPTQDSLTSASSAPINEIVYLSADLETGSHSFQSVRYMPYVSFGSRTAYSRGLLLASRDASPSTVTYRIPVGAKRFVAYVTPYDTFCDRSDINGWTVSVITPVNTLKFDQFYNNPDQKIVVPLDDIPANEPRLLTIVVDPHGDRTCDHPAFGNPHFDPSK